MLKKLNFKLDLEGNARNYIFEKSIRSNATPEEILEKFLEDLTKSCDLREWCNEEFPDTEEDSFLKFLAQEDGMWNLWDYLKEYDCFNESKANIEYWEMLIQNPEKGNWENLVVLDGEDYKKAYKNVIEYTDELKRDIEDEKKNMRLYQESLEDAWDEFMKWTSQENPDKEKEIQQVIDWKSDTEKKFG